MNLRKMFTTLPLLFNDSAFEFTTITLQGPSQLVDWKKNHHPSGPAQAAPKGGSEIGSKSWSKSNF